jgi:hypothetical protein
MEKAGFALWKSDYRETAEIYPCPLTEFMKTDNTESALNPDGLTRSETIAFIGRTSIHSPNLEI